jgi:hypothetical protein
MMNGAGVLSPSTLRMINETNAIYAHIPPSIQEAYRVTSQIATALNPSLLEAVRQAQETAQMMAPAIREWQENTAQLANLMTPAIRAAAEAAARMQIELQPLLRELRDVHPSIIQFTELFQEIFQYADEMDFSRDADEIDGLTEEEKQAAAKTVREILSQPDNWEQRLVKSLTAAQERHPVFAKAIIWILSAVIAIVLNVSANYLYDTIKPVKLREEPSQDAPVITVVNASQTVSVINGTRYYFEIEYTDLQTGETYSGWISKRSIKEHEEDESKYTEATP